MGGRGTSSLTAGGSVSSSNEMANGILKGLKKELSGIKPETKRQEALAKAFLTKHGNNPMAAINYISNTLVNLHERNLRELKNGKREIARQEAQIKRETKTMKSYSKETRTVTSVRGEKVQTNSKRYEVQADKVKMLNKSLTAYRSHLSSLDKSVKSFENNYTDEMRRIVRAGMLAKEYKKR